MNFLVWLVFVIPGLVVALFGCLAFLVDDKAGDKFKLLGFTSLFLAFLVAILSFVALTPITLTALAYAGIENLGIVILLVALSYVTNFAVGYGLVLAFTNRFAPNARERL